VSAGVRTLARGLALNRVLFGVGFIAFPGSGRTWVGKVAERPGAQVLARALGVRDLALAVGALAALGNGGSAKPWFAGQLAADVTDFLATWRVRDELPGPALAFALPMAAGSAAIAAAYLVNGEDEVEAADLSP
jgi:hypothetical protein